MRHLAKFLANNSGDMAIFKFYKMAASAILEFFKI